MKAVMLSIQPKWCELIASGEKTIEVRKTVPKLKTPFKCYIYQTKRKWIYRLLKKLGLYKGKVIGEFVCDRIELLPESIIKTDCYDLSVDTKRIVGESCLTREKILRYMGDNVLLYGWHISDLKIYDKPKELGEFFSVCHKLDCDKCGDCPHLRVEPCTYPCDDDIEVWCEVDNCKPLTRPPQSWCYVEEIL